MAANTQSPKVTTRSYSWEALISRIWGQEWNKPDIGYRFSNGRTFDNTDRSRGGPYGGDES